MSGASHLVPPTLLAPSSSPSGLPQQEGLAALMHPGVPAQLDRSQLVPLPASSPGAEVAAPPPAVPCALLPLPPMHSGIGMHAENSGDRGKKGRLRWTPELHALFVRAVDQLGGAFTATPKRILGAMALPGLTLHQVKSHVQKYRAAVAASKGKGKGARKGWAHAQPAGAEAGAGPAGAPAGLASSSEGAGGAAGGSGWLAAMEEDEEAVGAAASHGGDSSYGPLRGAGGQQPEVRLGHVASFGSLGLPSGDWGGDDAPDLSGLLMEWRSDELPPVEPLPPPSSAAQQAAGAAAASASSGGGAPRTAAGAAAAGAAAMSLADAGSPASAPRSLPAQQQQQPALGGVGGLREALRRQLEMQRQLSAALEAQRALQDQLKAHQAYIQRLLSACEEDEGSGPDSPDARQAAAAASPPSAAQQLVRQRQQQAPEQQQQEQQEQQLWQHQQLEQQLWQEQQQQQRQQQAPEQQQEQQQREQQLWQQQREQQLWQQQQQQWESQQQQQHEQQAQQQEQQQAHPPAPWQPAVQQQHGALPPSQLQPPMPPPQQRLGQHALLGAQPETEQQQQQQQQQQQSMLALARTATFDAAQPVPQPSPLPAAPAVLAACGPPGGPCMHEDRLWPAHAPTPHVAQSGGSPVGMAGAGGAPSRGPAHCFRPWKGLLDSSQATAPRRMHGPSGGSRW